MTASGIIATIGCIVGVVGAIIGVVGYFGGKQKQNADEAKKQGVFEGVITAKIDALQQSVEELKILISKSADTMHEEIAEAIKNHEEKYHKNVR